MPCLFQPGFEKQASHVLKALGYGSLKSIYGWTGHEVGKTLKLLSRIGGKPLGQYSSQTGKWIGQKGGEGWRNWLQTKGMYLTDDLMHTIDQRFKDAVGHASARHSKALGTALKYTPLATTGYLVGGGLLLGDKNPLTYPAHLVDKVWMYGSPMGLAMQAATKGVSSIGKAYGRTVATQTADQIANGIQEQGRMGHLYGLLSPDSFANKVREKANAGINQIFG